MINLRAPAEAAVADLRLVPLAVAGWAVAGGVLLAGPARAPVVLIGAAACCAALFVTATAYRARRGWTPTVVALAVVVAAVGALAWVRVESVRPADIADLAAAGRSASVDVVVTGDPAPLHGRWGGDRVRVGVRLEKVRLTDRELRVRVPATVFAPGESWRALLPGTHLRVRASFRPTSFRDSAALLTVRGPPQVTRPPGTLHRAAGALREGLRESVRSFPEDARALVPGMVLGDTSEVSEDLRDAERVAGLTHLTAVSGANVAIVLAAVLGLARRLGVRRRGLLAVGLVTVVAFVGVARPAPSLLRAAVMGSVVLIGVTRGSAGRGVQVLAAAVLLLLLVDPWLALSIGFALSVVATASLVLVAARLRDRFARRLPRRVAEPLAVATAAHLATVPLIAGISGRVSLVAVLANLLAEPAVVLVTITGGLATVLAPISPDLARLVALPAGVGASWIALVARRAAALPAADLPWPATPTGILAIGALSLAVLVRAARPVPASWDASADDRDDRTAAPRDPGRGARGPARRARGRHRRARRALRRR